MGITLQQGETLLEDFLGVVQRAAPMVGQFTGPAGAAIGTAVGAIAGMADAVVKEVTSDAAIIASGDTAKIKALQAMLQAQDDAISALIDAS